MSSLCPYCFQDTGKEITRKATCKACGKTMYVRGGQIVTEREKEIHDWSKFMDFLVPDIIPIRTTVESELRKRFKEEPASGDVVWGMFNYIVPRLHKFSDLSVL